MYLGEYHTLLPRDPTFKTIINVRILQKWNKSKKIFNKFLKIYMISIFFVFVVILTQTQLLKVKNVVYKKI